MGLLLPAIVAITFAAAAEPTRHNRCRFWHAQAIAWIVGGTLCWAGL